MTTGGWIYLGCALVLWRVFAGVIHRDEPEEGEVLAVLAALVPTMFWPLTLAIWALYKACVLWPGFMRRVFLHEPSRVRRERDLAAARKRVETLERELDLC